MSVSAIEEAFWFVFQLVGFLHLAAWLGWFNGKRERGEW